MQCSNRIKVLTAANQRPRMLAYKRGNPSRAAVAFASRNKASGISTVVFTFP
jgi:hypothetical protein